jgi:ELWxxDGT repeat protein
VQLKNEQIKFSPSKLAMSMLISISASLSGCGAGSGDANQKTGLPGAPAPITAPNMLLYANNGVTGFDLFQSDGTAGGTSGGTRLLADINVVKNAGISNLVVMGGVSYFVANDGIHGNELWRSDGTDAGTKMLKDINITPLSSSNPANLTVIGNTLYFSADDGSHGMELWKSDGTEANTVMVMDIVAGAGGSYPSSFGVIGSTLYFSASSSSFGGVLWKTNTATGITELVQPDTTDPSLIATYIQELTVVGNKLYFAATDGYGNYGSEPWVSDGTSGGTIMLSNILPYVGISPHGFTPAGSTVYFLADDGTYTYPLWRSDGTAASTYKFTLGNPGGSYAAIGNILYFNGCDVPRTNGCSPVGGVAALYKSDGNTASIVKVIGSGGDPYGFKVVGTTLYFTANDGTNGYKLWKSDGTGTGTALFADPVKFPNLSVNSSTLTAVGNTLYFTANDGINGEELWMRDLSTTADPVMVKNINQATGVGSNPANLLAVGNSLYFTADDGNGRQLWSSNGNSANTAMVKNISSSSEDSQISAVVTVNGIRYFNAFDGHSKALWRSDGKPDGTKIFMSNATVSSLTAVGNTLYFTASDSKGAHLWKSDATSTVPVTVSDLSCSNLTAVGNTLYFSAFDGTNGNELFKTNGIKTELVKNINAAPNASSNPSSLTAVGNMIYFVANDGNAGPVLWKSDGIDANTVMVQNINTAAGVGSNPYNLKAVGNTLYFVANDGKAGAELWKTDGTDINTAMVLNINTKDPAGSNPANLTAMSATNTLYFVANDGSNGQVLWMSNGDAATTKIVANINPGNLTVIGSKLFFSANDGTNGVELWMTDGLTNKTAMLKNINDTVPGASSNPSSFTVQGDKLFFIANDGVHGNELWVSDGTLEHTNMVMDLNMGLADGIRAIFP